MMPARPVISGEARGEISASSRPRDIRTLFEKNLARSGVSGQHLEKRSPVISHSGTLRINTVLPIRRARFRASVLRRPIIIGGKRVVTVAFPAVPPHPRSSRVPRPLMVGSATDSTGVTVSILVISSQGLHIAPRCLGEFSNFLVIWMYTVVAEHDFTMLNVMRPKRRWPLRALLTEIRSRTKRRWQALPRCELGFLG